MQRWQHYDQTKPRRVLSVELKKSLSFWDVFAIALGQVIGSGIMVLIGIGIEFTAYAIPIAFVLSACLSIIKQLPVAFMGSAMPATGGLYVYCKRVLGKSQRTQLRRIH